MSEIRVDTISEKTSANGVAVDGATLKDGTVKASINTSTQTTAAITLDNTVSGGFGASLAWDVHRSDSGNQATAARIYPSRADVWNSDAASDSDLNFQVSQNGTVATRMTVSGTGDVSIADGNVLFQGAGHGVYLGVTSATAANLLDDYEEGTYDVTFNVASGSLTPAGNNNALAYTKIGRVVHVQGQIKCSAVSSPSGNMSINLPFAVADLADGAARSTSGAIGQSSFGGTPNQTYYFRITDEGTATAFIATHNSGSDVGVNANQVTTNTEMIVSFTFIAA